MKWLRALLLAMVPFVQSWEWYDFVGGGSSSNSLSMLEVSQMRVRDIKRRLTRQHGYSFEEINRILDKSELIQKLAFEEHKLQQIEDANQKRALLIHGVVVAVLTIAVVACWPLFSHAWEVASVNLVVYTDRKRYEAKRCWELQSFSAMFGVLCMGILDGLQLWLTASVLLSWVTSSRFFFPTPSVPIRPAQFMGGEVASGPLSKYGLNVGPMIITWLMRFTHGRLETWTGQAMSKAYQRQKKKVRASETPEEKAARREARRERKAAREGTNPPAEPASDPMPSAQKEFQQHMDTYTPVLDDLD